MMKIIGVDYQFNSLDFVFNNDTFDISVTVTDKKDGDQYKLTVIDNENKWQSLDVNKTVTISNSLQPIKITVGNEINFDVIA